MFDGLTICPAQHGGFFVMDVPPPGGTTTFRFAGSLADCLEYVEKHLATPEADHLVE